MDEHAQWSDDAAAYALGALDPDESARFADHLRSCARCRATLTEMRSAAAAVPLGAPQLRAPKGLRRRLMTQLEQEARAARRARQARPRLWLERPAATISAAGAALAAAAVIAIVVITSVGTSTSPKASSRSYPGRVTFPGGSAVVRVHAGTAELVVRRMRAAPAGKLYEVWVARHGRPSPAGALFDVAADGRATVALPASLRGVSAVMVTAEPRGGSRRPTGAPVIDVPLA